MSINNINVEETLKNVREIMEKEKVSSSMRAAIEVILMLVEILMGKLGLNSKNSSTPPSADPNRKKKPKKGTGKKPGGQPGHVGAKLEKTDKPDEIQTIKLDKQTLPKGKTYKQVGVKKRQVFDIILTQHVIEYQAEVWEDEDGKRYVAPFPDGVDRPVQYGPNIKAHSVYLSQGQLLPVDRVTEYFRDQVGIPLSAGSVVNFNREAYKKLASFEENLIQALIKCNLINADETGININGKRVWIHGNGNEKYTFLKPHKKRGQEAMDDMGVLPYFKGYLCHDHWKPYFRYTDATHCLCNAHHLRELEGIWEKNHKQEWAKKMQKLLLEMNEIVNEAGGVLEEIEAEKLKIRYRKILEEGEQESPLPKPPPEGVSKKRGRIKKTDARNLLERLRDFEDETLRFMTVLEVPFTNNLGERDIRMTKVQQKISGCFRSWDGAETFCRIRSYLATCKKNGESASEALTRLFAKNSHCPIFGAE